MAYVDLNPVRAAMATTPEQSDQTSIQHRIRQWKRHADGHNDNSEITDHPEHAHQPGNLHPFVGNDRQELPKGVIFNLIDYLELVNWTGRQASRLPNNTSS